MNSKHIRALNWALFFFIIMSPIKTKYMSQTFESLMLEIQESLSLVASPTDLTLALSNALQKAETYEEEWINDLYERSDDYFKDFIY